MPQSTVYGSATGLSKYYVFAIKPLACLISRVPCLINGKRCLLCLLCQLYSEKLPEMGTAKQPIQEGMDSQGDLELKIPGTP
jgi:hypothetical protein